MEKNKTTNARVGGRIYCPVSPETAPQVISLEYNGVRAVMLKTSLPEHGVCWAGTPVDGNGKGCRFQLVISSTGAVIGGGAVNFFAAGGWNSSSRNALTPDAVAQAHEAINRGWLHHVTMVQSVAKQEESRSQAAEQLNGYLPLGIDLYKAEAATDLEEMELILSMVGAPRTAVSAAKAAGLAISVDLDRLVGNLVSPKFAEVMEGAWDEDAELASIASNLSAGVVYLMKRYGRRLVKASEAAKIRAAEEAAKAAEADKAEAA